MFYEIFFSIKPYRAIWVRMDTGTLSFGFWIKAFLIKNK